MRQVDRLQVADEDLRKVQDRILAVLNPLARTPVVDGVLVTGVALSATPTDVSHKLQRMPLGYLIVGLSADARVWETRANRSSTRLTLTASAAATVDLWVF